MFNYVVYGATHRLHPAPLWPVRVGDDEDGDGLSFGGKQHLRVGNYILLALTRATRCTSENPTARRMNTRLLR